MRGKVTAASLNVRDRPEQQRQGPGTSVAGHNRRDSRRTIQLVRDFASRRNGVRPGRLRSPRRSNQYAEGARDCRAAQRAQRAEPDRTHHGHAPRRALANVLGEHEAWLEIECNHGNGFVSGNYVDVIDGDSAQSADDAKG